MTQPEFADRLARCLDGELSDGEAVKLWQEIVSDEQALQEFLSIRELDHDLKRVLTASGSEEAFLRGVLSAASEARKSDTSFIRQVVGRYVERQADPESKPPEGNVGAPARGTGKTGPAPRLSTRRQHLERTSGPSGPWILLWAAACLLFGLLVTLALGPSAERNGGPKAARGPAPAATRPDESRQRAEEAKARADREELEIKLAATEEERRRVVEAKKRADGREKEAELRAREAELERVAQEFRTRLATLSEKEERLAAKAPPGAETPARKPETQERPATQAAVATIDQAEGEAFVVGKAGRSPAQPGMELFPGQGLEITGGQGRLVLAFGDKTRLEAGPDTRIPELRADGGKRVVVDRGTVRAEVAKQRKDQPMIFATPHGEAKVLGTTLRIIVDPDPKRGTRLEVEEGKVELKRLTDGRAVIVESRHYAVAAAGAELAPKAMPINEILLLPRDGRRFGEDWKLVKDLGASTGAALEAGAAYKWTDPVAIRASFALFRFTAEANKDYQVWIRGCCLATQERAKHDSVALEPMTGQFGRKYTWQGRTLSENVYLFDGLCDLEGYGWISGKMTLPPEGDTAPISIRFNRSGEQILKLYVIESPMRVDAIWLSATQKTRPDPGQRGPATEPK